MRKFYEALHLVLPSAARWQENSNDCNMLPQSSDIGHAGTVGPPDEKLTCGIKDRFAEKVRSELGHKTENVVWQ